MKPHKLKLIEEKIVQAIYDDMFGRGGLDNAYDEIDDDIKQEMWDTQVEIVKNHIQKFFSCIET